MGHELTKSRLYSIINESVRRVLGEDAYNSLCKLLNKLDTEKVVFENDDMRRNYDIDELTISRMSDERYIILNKIVINNRNEGSGTRLMNDLCRYCDNTDKILCVTPDTTFGASSVSRLKSFYKKFGFIENKGRHSDFMHRESMYRKPNKEEK